MLTLLLGLIALLGASEGERVKIAFRAYNTGVRCVA